MLPTVYLSVGASYGVTHRMLCALVLPEAQVNLESCGVSFLQLYSLRQYIYQELWRVWRGWCRLETGVTGGNAAGGLALRGKASTWKGKEDSKSNAKKMSNRVLFPRWAIGFSFLLVQLSQSRAAKHRFRQTQPLTQLHEQGASCLTPLNFSFLLERWE